MKRILLVLLSLVVLAPVGARATVVESTLGPGEPAFRDFPADFKPLLPIDKQAETAAYPQWTDRHVGGWGGEYGPGMTCPADHEARTPVIFVHGTTEDASFWRDDTNDPLGTIVNVRNQFLAQFYCARELWAISYDGYPGYFTSNDINAEEVYQFIEAVRTYLGVDKVDIVAHSLGVTVVRKAAFLHRDLYQQMRRFVPIAGANHGTTACRGVGTAHGSTVCIETEPGSAWLAELNGIGETPPGPEYLDLYEGTGTTDNFYLGPDGSSPALAGACNHPMPYTPHNTLGHGSTAISIYFAFLSFGTLPTCV